MNEFTDSVCNAVICWHPFTMQACVTIKIKWKPSTEEVSQSNYDNRCNSNTKLVFPILFITSWGVNNRFKTAIKHTHRNPVMSKNVQIIQPKEKRKLDWFLWKLSQDGAYKWRIWLLWLWLTELCLAWVWLFFWFPFFLSFDLCIYIWMILVSMSLTFSNLHSLTRTWI